MMHRSGIRGWTLLGLVIRSWVRSDIPPTAFRQWSKRHRVFGLLSCVVCCCVSLPDDRVRLRTFRPLDDVELDVIALFQSLVTIQLDCRVVNENIWPVFTSDESVALGVVKPLDLAFVLSHRVLPFLPL